MVKALALYPPVDTRLDQEPNNVRNRVNYATRDHYGGTSEMSSLGILRYSWRIMVNSLFFVLLEPLGCGCYRICENLLSYFW